MNYSAGFMLN